MIDMQASLDKLRVDAAEVATIRDTATTNAKRELFDRLSIQLATLAREVERAMAMRLSLACTRFELNTSTGSLPNEGPLSYTKGKSPRQHWARAESVLR
jgi:hypothetical protein